MPNCPLLGLVRFVAYLCAMIGNGVNSLNSPITCWLVDWSTTRASL